MLHNGNVSLIKALFIEDLDADMVSVFDHHLASNIIVVDSCCSELANYEGIGIAINHCVFQGNVVVGILPKFEILCIGFRRTKKKE
ncbi:hypothetical protein D3C85_938920 [compost metagenome]